MRTLLLLFCFYRFSYADGLVEINQLQDSCIILGHNLIELCVDTEGDWQQCMINYNLYVACINQLNQPLPLEYKKELDNLKKSPFSPCGYEISHLILGDKCY